MTHILSRVTLWLILITLVLTSFSFISNTAGAEEEAEPTFFTAITAQLIELSSTDVPTTIIVRENPEGEFTDHTIDINEETWIRGKKMEDWITGDYLHIIGTLNQNTLVITASSIQNNSINNEQRGLNGWITEIGDSTMTVEWAEVEHIINITDATRMVVPPINPAALTDFEVGDRVRLRLEADTNNALIIVALRRGDEIFLKARTRGFWAELKEIALEDQYMTVELGFNKHLNKKDVNNLVGIEGELLTITWDDHTRFVQKYFGRTTPDEFMTGDQLFIVGRVNDEGTILARLVKNSGVHEIGAPRHRGKIISVDTENDSIEAKLPLKKKKWTVNYTEETEIFRNGSEATEDELERGDNIQVAGLADLSTRTIDADKIVVFGKTHKPKQRIRWMNQIIKHRIRSSLGLVDPEDFFENQEPVGTGTFLTDEEIEDLEEEFEDELEDLEEEEDDEDDEEEDENDDDDSEDEEEDDEDELS